MKQDAAISTVARRQERDREHHYYECVSHERPGERERIAFHVHEFDHGCYGKQCPEADRLYAAWHTALAGSPPEHHRAAGRGG